MTNQITNAIEVYCNRNNIRARREEILNGKIYTKMARDYSTLPNFYFKCANRIKRVLSKSAILLMNHLELEIMNTPDYIKGVAHNRSYIPYNQTDIWKNQMCWNKRSFKRGRDELLLRNIISIEDNKLYFNSMNCINWRIPEEDIREYIINIYSKEYKKFTDMELEIEDHNTTNNENTSEENLEELLERLQ